MSQINKKIAISDLKKSEQIVVRTGKSNFIDKLIFPNPVTIGLDDNNLRSLLTTEGGIKINPAVPTDISGTLYNSGGMLYFDGSPLISGGKNSNLSFDVKNNILRLAGTLEVTGGGIRSSKITGSITQLANGDQYIRSGDGISVTTGSTGQLTISALVQDTGIRAVTVGTAISNVPDTLHNKTIIFTDAEGRTVTFTYDKTRSFTAPLRVSASNYKIGCLGATTETIHARGIVESIELARLNADLNILTSRSDNVITITQGKGGTTGNTSITGTAVSSSLIVFSNSSSFVGGSATLPGVNAHYLTLAHTGDLNNERVLTAGLGLSSIDSGPNSSFTLAIDDNIVPKKNSSNTFAEMQTFTGEIRGTHQKLSDGTSAFVAGKNVRITNNLNGSLTFEATDTDTTYTAGGGLKLTGNQFSLKLNSGGPLSLVGDTLALNTAALAGAYLSSDSSGRLRVNLAPGRGLVGTSNNIAVSTDDLAGNGLLSSEQRLIIDDRKVATVTGTNFTGNVDFSAGLRGSLTHLVSGKSYIAAGDNVHVVTESDGQITISSSYVDTTYLPGPGIELSGTTFSVALKDHGGLTFDDTEVILDTQTVIGEGLVEGTSGLIAVDHAQVAFLSGTKFTGPVNFDAGLRGSLTKLTDGSSFIVAGSNILITSASNGSIEIASTAAGSAIPAGFTGDIQVNVSGSFAAFEGFFYDDVNLTLHAPKFSSPQITGSITQLYDGSPFIVSGPNITITTESNGQILISGAPTTLVAARRRATYVVTGAHPANTPLQIPGIDFSLSNFAQNLIDVTCNGALLYSGSSAERNSSTVDYSLFNSSSISFAFDLAPDDVIQASMLTSGSDTVTVVPGGATGVDKSVQFNDAGNFGGDAYFTYNASMRSLTVPSITGSLTRLSNGDPFLTTSGTIIGVVTSSAGAIIVSDTYHTVPAIVYGTDFSTPGSKYIAQAGPITITSSSNSVSIGMRREKFVYEITSSHPAGSVVSLPGAQFSIAQFDEKRIDIYVNGQLLTSGSERDYELEGTDEGIKLLFDLLENDIIVAVVQ